MKRTKEKNFRIMIIGAISYPNRDKSIGGCTVLMENFLQYCKNSKVDFIHVSTNRWEGRLAFLRNFLYFFCFLHLLLNSIPAVRWPFIHLFLFRTFTTLKLCPLLLNSKTFY